MAKKYRNKVMNDVADAFLDKIESEAQAWFDDILTNDTPLRVGHGDGSYFNQTLNLYDSFGYGIYLDGTLLRSNATERQKEATEPRKWHGDELWGNALMRKTFSKEGFKPSERGYVVVFAAAMPYTGVLQEGLSHGLSRDYHVIAFMSDELRNFGKRNFGKSLVREVKDTDYYLARPYE